MATCPKTCGTKLSYAQMHTLLRQAGCPESRIVIMGAIGMAESNGCTAIIGCISPNEWSIGVWQINTKVHKNFTIEQLKNPVNNAKEAVRILNSQGLRAWGAYTDGRYKPYVSGSQAAYSGQNVPVNVPTNSNSNSNFQPARSQFEFSPGMAIAGILVIALLLD